MTLDEKINKIYLPKIKPISNGYFHTIDDLWTDIIEPTLPPKDVVIGWYKLLYQYTEDKEATYVLRMYHNYDGNNHDPKVLRRGFEDRFSNLDCRLFYTDNFFAAYFAKMAIDNYLPKLEEFKKMMKDRTFPARFGRYCKEEREKASYSIDGTVGRDPGIKNAGYKIAHIFNAGEDYWNGSKEIGLAAICDRYFPRGKYDDWERQHDGLYARILSVSPDGINYLKAHFLRFTCPMNYVFTPQKKLQSLKISVFRNDISESKELQQYLIHKCHERYGEVYDEFISHIMVMPCKTNGNSELSNNIIGLTIDTTNIPSNKIMPINSKVKVKSNSSGVGLYAKSVFSNLISSGKLPASLLSNLMDKTYCSDHFGVSFPIIVNISSAYEHERYYKDVFCDCYKICNMWYERHRARIDSWLISNNF